MNVALLTHAQAEPDGRRMLTRDGAAASRRAGVALSDDLRLHAWPPVSRLISAPALRCVGTLVAVVAQLSPDQLATTEIETRPELAERPGEGLSAERLRTAVVSMTDGATLVAVHGDLPSAFSPGVLEHFNSAYVEEIANVRFFGARPAVLMMSFDASTSANPPIDLVDAKEFSNEESTSLLNPAWY